MAQVFWWWSQFQGTSMSWQQKREFHRNSTRQDWTARCPLQTAWLDTHLHPGAKELLWEAEFSLPSSTGFLYACHKIVGSRKRHQEPFSHFTQETLPRPMLYTAAGDLGEQKGTLSPFSTLPLISLPTATYSSTSDEGKEGTLSSYLPWQLFQRKSACRQH